MKDFITKLAYAMSLGVGVALVNNGQHFWGGVFISLYATCMYDRGKS